MRVALLSLLFLTLPSRGVGQSLLSGADGKTLYHAACANCHASDGKGASKDQVGFDTPLPDFTDCSYASREAGQDWFTIVHEGGPRRGFSRRMPAFGGVLTAQEIDRVVTYMRSLCHDMAWPRGELNLPRATFTEKAFPEDESVLTGRVTGGNDGNTRFDYVHEKRFGARNQLEVAVPMFFGHGSGTSGGRGGAHLGDISLGLKRVLFHTQSLTAASIVSAGGEVVVPTGDADLGFGNGTPVVEPFVLGARMLGTNAFVQFHGGLEFPMDQDKAPSEGFVRAVLGRSLVSGGFGRQWTPMLEVLYTREFVRGAVHELDVVPQMQVSLSKRQHIMASAGLRLPVTERTERKREFVFYLMWDWFDGGLRDGW